MQVPACLRSPLWNLFCVGGGTKEENKLKRAYLGGLSEGERQCIGEVGGQPGHHRVVEPAQIPSLNKQQRHVIQTAHSPSSGAHTFLVHFPATSEDDRS